MKKVHNKSRKFGAALNYYQAKLSGAFFLFTENEIQTAKKRAEENPEDIDHSIEWKEKVVAFVAGAIGLILGFIL
jgi:hypothetical protein